ncbi:MAG: hypothetical protein RIC14_04970 [Filomicrobium sp.]
MNFSRENIIYGSVAGAIIGLGYVFARAYFTNDYSDLVPLNIVFFAGFGALGGVLALAIRGS